MTFPKMDSSLISCYRLHPQRDFCRNKRNAKTLDWNTRYDCGPLGYDTLRSVILLQAFRKTCDRARKQLVPPQRPYQSLG